MAILLSEASLVSEGEVTGVVTELEPTEITDMNFAELKRNSALLHELDIKCSQAFENDHGKSEATIKISELISDGDGVVHITNVWTRSDWSIGHQVS